MKFDPDILEAFNNAQPTCSATKGHYVNRSGREFKHPVPIPDASLNKSYDNTDRTNPYLYASEFFYPSKGQILYYRNKYTDEIGEIYITDFKDGFIYFSYNHKAHRLPSNVVGSRLFASRNDVPPPSHGAKSHPSMERMPSGGIYKSPLEE